jgi:hypothetical protein
MLRSISPSDFPPFGVVRGTAGWKEGEEISGGVSVTVSDYGSTVHDCHEKSLRHRLALLNAAFTHFISSLM